MRRLRSHQNPASAIHAIAEIKAALDAFNRGDTNVFLVLDTIVVAVEAYQLAASGEPRLRQRRRRAA
jgi:hypothetical protein